MTLIIQEREYDNQDGTKDLDLFKKEKGFGFRTKEGKIYLQRCPDCGQENYAAMVSLGKCAWCGFDVNDPKHGADKN